MIEANGSPKLLSIDSRKMYVATVLVVTLVIEMPAVPEIETARPSDRNVVCWRPPGIGVQEQNIERAGGPGEEFGSDSVLRLTSAPRAAGGEGAKTQRQESARVKRHPVPTMREKVDEANWCSMLGRDVSKAR